MARKLAPLVLLLLSGCASGPAPPTPTPAAIEGPLLVDAEAPGGEPMLALAPDGTIYLQAVAEEERQLPTSAAWRSDDGGRTFVTLTIPAAAAADSYDGAIAAGPGGEVWLANAQQSTLRLWRSDDRGATWREEAGPRVAAAHRMWLVPSAGRLDVGVDTLGGPSLHFALPGGPPSPVAPTYDVGGTLARRDDGLLLWPRHESAPLDRYVAWRSADGGATWTSAPITAGAPPETFPVGEARRTSLWTPTAFDADGAAYHAWSERGTILLARSLDDGATWSPPVALTREGEFALLPWMTPRLDVVALVEQDSGWSPIALRLDWPLDEAAPRVRRATLPGVLHEGPICIYGQGCPPAERALGDFSAAATLADGTLVAAFGSTALSSRYASAPVVYRVPDAAFA